MENNQPASAGRRFAAHTTTGFRKSDLGYVLATFEDSTTPVYPPADVDAYRYFLKELYEPMCVNPWADAPFFYNNIDRWAQLLPRPSEAVPGAIAYYQTPEKRLRDILSPPIKAGRFLAKFFGDILTQPEIQYYALKWETKFKIAELHVTQDPDEIEKVYTRGPNSCMKYSAYHYSAGIHPTRTYAGPDLAIGYIGTLDNPEARVILWPDKMIHIDTPYGDRHRILAALKAAGYAQASDHEFTGARIRRIKHGKQYVVPYSDTHDCAYDNGEYLILGRGEINIQTTSGVSGSIYECDDCGEDCGDDHYTIVSGDCVCEGCLEEHYFFCTGNEEYYHNDHMVSTIRDDYGSYSNAYVTNDRNWFYCDITEMWYPTARYQKVELIEGGDCVMDEVDRRGFYCAYSEQWSLETSKELQLTNGNSVHIDSFACSEDLVEYLTDHPLLEPLKTEEAA